MKFTKEELQACQRELERCAMRPWVSCAAVPEPAWNAFERLGWGLWRSDEGGTDLFREGSGNNIDGQEVATAAAFVLSISEGHNQGNGK